MKKRFLSLLLTLALCLPLGTFVLPQQARADSAFDTSKTYFIWLKEDDGELNYRWNADGLGKRDVIHLDVPSGGNCVMTFTASEEDGYYGIRFEDRYVNTKDNNEKAGQYLHQWEDFYEGGNQKYRFIPVEGEADTYYIQMKKGGLYVGVQNNKAEKDSIVVTANDADKCKWVVVSTEASFPTGKTQTFDTSSQYYLWLKDGKGDDNYRWNANGTGQGDKIHLDTPSGGNCRFTFTDAGDGYYGIKCKDRYVDTKDNVKQLGRVLHQWDKEVHQDNQKFRFIPVEGETDTYYIQIKNNGSFVGLEGYGEPAENRNLVSADADHACQWVVVPTFPPLGTNALLPGAKDHQGDPYYGALTFTMNPLGYQNSLSVNHDAKSNGDEVQLWTMGHMCKVTAEYIGKDKNDVTQDAYRIRSFDYFESTTDTSDVGKRKEHVWDVFEKSMDDGAVIHVWEKGDDDKASTLWKFIAVPGETDVYYIQNVNSHLYLGLDSEKDEDGVILKQTSKKIPWELHWLYAGDDTNYYYSYFVERDGSITDSYEGISPGNWMSRLPDDLPLSQINIPGTHDAAAARFWTTDSNFINEGVGQILAQMLYLDEQLNAGVRAWDIRIKSADAEGDDAQLRENPHIIHGKDPVECHDRWGSTLHLDGVMNTARDFLSTHPQETIVIKIGGDGSGDKLSVISNALSYYLLADVSAEQQAAIDNGELTYDDIGPRYPIYIPSKEALNSEVPTLGDVRGKIVFLNGAGVPFHYAVPGDEKSDKIPDELTGLDEYLFRACGPNISPWVTSKIEADPPKNLQKIKDTCAWAQDTYNTSDVSLKMEYVDGVFDDLSRHHQTDSAYVLNFASATDKIKVSKGIYEELREDKTLDQTSGIRANTGLLFVNEIDPVMTRRIYMTNFDLNGTALPTAWGVFFDANGGVWSKVPEGCTASDYDSDDSIIEVSRHVNAGDAATQPADPVRSGYTLKSWQLNGADYDFNTPVTGPVTLTANWEVSYSSGGGGGTSAPANPVSLSPASAAGAAAHGRVSSSAASAKAGEKVTLTPEPEEGYALTGVTVTDKNGKEVPVTANADGTFTFTMPVTAVTVTPVFEEIAEPDSPDLPGAPGIDVSGRFTDVSETAWYHDAVQWAVDRGLMNGVSEDTFAPNGTATRAMVVTMLWRLAGEPAASEPAGFSDVSGGAWYADAVAWAAETAAVNGVSDAAFDPNAPVTREQLAAILYRYAQAQGKGFTGAWMFLLDFPDASGVSDWAGEAMHWMVMHGVITGMDDGTLAPRAEATRAQIATMFMRFAAEMEKEYG